MHFESERTSLGRRQNKTREWRGGTRRDPQLTSRLRPLPLPSLPPPSPSALGICWSRRTTRTYIRETLCQALSRRTTPSYGHHPQFAFLKGAQKPPEIAAGSSDVTAGTISVPLDRSPPPPSLPIPFISFCLVHVCLSFSSLFIYLPLLPSTISRVGTYRGGKSSDNGGFG